MLLSCLGSVFVVAVTFLAAAFLRGQVATIAVALGAMFVAVPSSSLIPGAQHIGPAAFTALPTT